jgi:hypothetical protein
MVKPHVYNSSNIVKLSRLDFAKVVPNTAKVVIYKTNGGGRDGYIV